MVRPRESNPRPPALQSNALPTELILPRFGFSFINIQAFLKKKSRGGSNNGGRIRGTNYIQSYLFQGQAFHLKLTLYRY